MYKQCGVPSHTRGEGGRVGSAGGENANLTITAIHDILKGLTKDQQSPAIDNHKRTAYNAKHSINNGSKQNEFK